MISILENVYMAILEPFIKYAGRLSDKTKNILMIIAFISMNLLFLGYRLLKQDDNYYIYNFIGVFIIIVIIFLSLDKKLEKLEYRTPAMFAWIALGITMMASDYLYRKTYFGVGILLLFLFTMIGFVWSNHSDIERLWMNFIYGTRFSFLAFTVYALIRRPRKENMRYAGVFINPNIMGLYLIAVFACYMILLECAMKEEKSIKKSIGLFAEMGMGMFFLFMTQSRTSMLAVAMTAFVWFAVRLAIARRNKQMKRLLAYIGCILLGVGIMFPICYKALEIIPNAINHPKVYDYDKDYAKADFGQKVLAAEDDKDETLKRFWNASKDDAEGGVLNGRVPIYKDYAKKITFFGGKGFSSKDSITQTRYIHAHNNVLQMGYTYGVYAMAAYIVLAIIGLLSSFLYWIKNDHNNKLAALPFIIMLSFHLASITETILIPFLSYPAFVFYLCISNFIFKRRS